MFWSLCTFHAWKDLKERYEYKTDFYVHLYEKADGRKSRLIIFSNS